MSQHLCATCTRFIADGATICAACAHILDANLAEVCAYHGLGWDLDDAMTRRTHVRLSAGELAEEKRVPGVLVATPLPYNPRAGDAARKLHGTLTSWAKLVCDETGAVPPRRDTIPAVATWLRPWVGWLRHHPAGDEAFDEISRAVSDARRVVDRPADKLYAGVCDCGAHLYATLGTLTVICRSVAHEEPVVWPVEDRRAQLLAAVDDHLANAQQMARLLGYLGVTVPDSTIRWWASKGRLAAHGQDGKRNPLYRLGEVVRVYAQSNGKAS